MKVLMRSGSRKNLAPASDTASAILEGRLKGPLYVGTLLALALLFLCFPLHAHADGGAPNLAYVAGAAGGISVIDIAQQKVTGKISASGDPHTLYLSLDGRFLYVTEPVLGRVTMFAAKTGQTICSA